MLRPIIGEPYRSIPAFRPGFGPISGPTLYHPFRDSERLISSFRQTAGPGDFLEAITVLIAEQPLL